MKKNLKKRSLKASFSIELSLIILIIFIGIGNLILYINKNRIKVSYEYINHYGLIKMINKEKVFDLENKYDKEIIGQMTNMTKDINENTKIKINFDKGLLFSKIKLRTKDFDMEIKQKTLKALEFMRISAALERVVNGN